MTEVQTPMIRQYGPAATLTRRSFAQMLRKGFELLGGMERRELLQMLHAHRVPKDLVDMVKERVPEGTRVAGLRGLWDYLDDLPLDGETAPDPDQPLFQIGEVADRTGLSLRSLRYYDEAGLVHPSARSDGNFRLYSEDDIQRLETAKTMKPVGLSIEEMREVDELLQRSAEPDLLSASEASETARRLQEYAERSDERIVRLERDLEQARALRLRIGEHVARCV